MKKTHLLLMLLCAAVLSLTGCDEKKPSAEEEKAAALKGEEMMRTWLSENMPGAELESCDVYVDYVPGGKNYMTDYACGSILKDGEKTHFAVNTVTGAVYLDEKEEELEQAAAAYLYETMGIVPKPLTFSCTVMAPARDGGSTTKTFNDSFNFGIPAGTEDLDAFVRHPESRPPLQISAELRVPDDTDLFDFDLAGLEKLCEDCGMFFQNLDMYNTDQEFSSLWSRETYTKQFGRIEKEGLQLHCVLRRREEIRDRKTKELTVSDLRMDPDKDLILEKTESGFRYSCPDKDLDYGFRIYAEADSGYPEHDYLYREVETKSDGKTSESAALLMTWAEQKDGSYGMVLSGEGVVTTFYRSGTFEQKN